ncbi:MAG: hypothetical protein M1836_007955 [Candelina mexicana]|nr:MAG: hypothetical protein M1836_007955 [Candelina mexicana]
MAGANTSCLAKSTYANSTNNAIHPHRVRPRSITSRAGQSTVVSDGFTYSTSPSVYLAYHDISASNFCGQVGSKHTSITLALNPEDVSSVEGVDYHDQYASTSIQIGSSQLVPGGSTVTISVTPFYLDPSINLIVGNWTVAAAASSITSPLLTLATAGEKIVVLKGPCDIKVGGTQLDIGGSIVIVNGTPVHLDSSTKLVVGTWIVTFALVATPTSAGAGDNGLGGAILSGLACLGPIGPKQTGPTLTTATSTGNGSFDFQIYRDIASRSTGVTAMFIMLGLLAMGVLALT